MLVGLWTLLAGCDAANPVENCDSFPATDCCSTHNQCFEFYGSEFPFCVSPERKNGGTCSECARNDDCAVGQACDIDSRAFGVCL